MCRAFSGIITMEGKVYWQAGIDSHEDLLDKFKSKDNLLRDDKLPATFCRFEIFPENWNYLNPDGSWIFSFDDKKPKWWTKEFKELCYRAHKEWKKQIYNSFNLEEANNPINPFEIEPPKKITKKHLNLLKEWAYVGNAIKGLETSVWASVESSIRASIWDSVGESIGDSVADAVWIEVWLSIKYLVTDSIQDSLVASNEIGASVRTSIYAYIGSLFPNIKKWEYADKIKTEGYPFQSAVDLWKMGLVPSYDGKVWRLHSKNGIEWEGVLNWIRKILFKRI